MAVGFEQYRKKSFGLISKGTSYCSSVHFFDSRMQFSSADAVQLFDSRMRQDREERDERREREERAPSDPTAWGTHQCYVNIEEKIQPPRAAAKIFVPFK